MKHLRHHRPSRRDLIDRLPITRAVAPSLTADTIDKLELVHRDNLAALKAGTNLDETLHNWYRGVLTMWIAADMDGTGAPEMHAQLVLIQELVARYEAAGRTLTLAPYELEALAEGVDLMQAVSIAVPASTLAAAAAASDVAVGDYMAGRRAAA